jgi:hypothetical protein
MFPEHQTCTKGKSSRWLVYMLINNSGSILQQMRVVHEHWNRYAKTSIITPSYSIIRLLTYQLYNRALHSTACQLPSIETIQATDNTYQLSIIDIRNYKLKSPLMTHSYRQSHVTEGTGSPGDALPFGPRLQVQCSGDVQHVREKKHS